MKIAIVSDIHTPGSSDNPQIRGELAEMLLLRAINRFNRWIKPDIAIICGDIVDGNDNDVARLWLEKCRQILEKLACPYIAVRGNHDPSADYFYRIFPRKEHVNINGFRFLVFDDPSAPLFNASRTADQIARFKEARANFAGPIISVQHVPLFEPGTSECPYNYTNAKEIISEMKKQNIFMTISGHWHKGMGHIQSQGINYIASAALSESPFRYSVVELDGDKIGVQEDCLQMPPELGLIDRHVHTQMAYCSENMDAANTLKHYKDFGLADVVFTEHSGQLYFNNELFWTGDCYKNGLADIKEKENRMAAYFELMRRNNVPAKSIGLETDVDYAGRAMIKPKDRERVGFLLGSIHKLQEMWKEQIDIDAIKQEYLFRTEAVLKSGVNVLAHPFRLFMRKQMELPKDLFGKVIKLLKQYNIAAEVNFHSQEAESEFFQMCVNSGVKLSLSSDCHNMYELGELWPHLRMLEKIGVSTKDLSGIVL